jgi:hypothetical protein
MTVSSVAPEEIVTIILRLLVDGTEVFRSSHQYLVAFRYLIKDLRDVSTVMKNRKVAIRTNISRTWDAAAAAFSNGFSNSSSVAILMSLSFHPARPEPAVQHAYHQQALESLHFQDRLRCREWGRQRMSKETTRLGRRLGVRRER